jgi:diguanylate cyclase (GGDEF)-like protein
MVKEIDYREDVPQEITDQLWEGMFSAPSTAVRLFVAGLVIAVIVLWWHSQDVAITAALAIAAALNISRIAVVYYFRRHNRSSNCARSGIYWALLYMIGSCISLDIASLVARAFFLGNLLLVALAALVASGYVIGVVIRASAVPRLAMPHLLLLFVPLIVLAAWVPDRQYLLIAPLLGFFCVACLNLSSNVHQILKARLLAEHQLSLCARTDYLTGLANRARFDAHGALLLREAQSNRRGCSLALADLDGFKAVNDTLGHAAGDELLKQVGARIKAVLGGRHFLARLGGDEFAVLFDPDIGLAEATALGDEIVGGLRGPFQIAGATLQISGSVGIAMLEDPADTFASIMERADRALYRAKNAGRNQAQVLLAPDLAPSIMPSANRASAEVTLIGDISMST